MLTAVSTLADPDGLGTLHYDWQRDTGSGFVSTGAADQATYTLGDADVGGLVRVVVSYTDGGGTAETETSAATAAMAGVNDPHTGGVSITGTATEDQVLTAVSTLADIDGLGTLHYQWQHDVGSGFVNIGAADQATYTLGDGDVGGLVRVVVSYTDGQGFAESATSASTAAIANVNDAPTGGVVDHRHGDREPGADGRYLDAGRSRWAGHTALSVAARHRRRLRQCRRSTRRPTRWATPMSAARCGSSSPTPTDMARRNP